MSKILTRDNPKKTWLRVLKGDGRVFEKRFLEVKFNHIMLINANAEEEEVKIDDNSMVQKYSRYLTVRRHAANSDSPFEPKTQKPLAVQNDVSKIRSMGRYRRPKLTSRTDSPLVAPTIKPIAVTTTHELQHEDLIAAEDLSPRQISENGSEDAVTVSNIQVGQQYMVQDEKEFGSTVCRTSSHMSAADLIAEQKVKDLQRLQVQLNAATPTISQYAAQKSKKESKLVGLFSKRKESKCTPPNTPKNPSLSIMTKSSPGTQQGMNQNIEQGGGGIVPQIDAPISAINAGERRVLVRFKQSSISLLINLETTAVDLIHSTGDVLSKQITSSSTILLESFLQLGLERPIRKYERIRDVMNSWDRDTQNALILEQQDHLCEASLDVDYVPLEAPAGITVILYHSHKPGKWKKRHVTLLSSGQMSIAKNAGAKSTDKGYLNICHLSDFDIYKPMSERARKNHNPPEKNLFAIKSQQKTTMFLSSENYVHYFSTHDDLVGQKFYDAVQRWRSWFLVNRNGERDKGLNQSHTTQSMLSRSDFQATQSRRSSTVENSNLPRPLQPLIDLNQVTNQKLDNLERSKSHIDDQSSKSSSRRNSRKYPHNVPINEEGEFPSTSLLGRTYTERKRELLEENINQQRNAIALVTKMNHEAQSPRGLVDLTDSVKELPQWNRTNKGHGIRPIDGVPLVDIACSPGIGSQRVDMSRSNTLLGRKDSKFSQKSGRQNFNSATDEGPFVEGGLISAFVANEARTGLNYKMRSRY
ncbi:putative pleckstrin-like protein [Erysiphe neolycopersici]|uniref:Putative pleckstrin-like protein n=1 Tax=Erysiphe neolycopersici TaxID=212602 RepID=A0A420H743_9PEZI|nr:putative pleckstrin-like protein [Erysiphe neolycopersici]